MAAGLNRSNSIKKGFNANVIYFLRLQRKQMHVVNHKEEALL